MAQEFAFNTAGSSGSAFLDLAERNAFVDEGLQMVGTGTADMHAELALLNRLQKYRTECFGVFGPEVLQVLLICFRQFRHGTMVGPVFRRAKDE